MPRSECHPQFWKFQVQALEKLVRHALRRIPREVCDDFSTYILVGRRPPGPDQSAYSNTQ